MYTKDFSTKGYFLNVLVLSINSSLAGSIKTLHIVTRFFLKLPIKLKTRITSVLEMPNGSGSIQTVSE